MKNAAIYPGSFDPPTNGHIDILERAVNKFDKVVITIAVNNKKKALFTGEERLQLLKNAIKDKPWADKVEMELFTGLLIDFARKKEIGVLVRGIRQISDFEYEFRMALTNRRLAPEIDTIFLMPDEQLTFISATIVKEVAAWGGDLSSFVPPNVEIALRKKYATE